MITKHAGTGGVVNTGTVTAQLLYEIGAPAYPNPDVVARFDTIELHQQAPDRVLISGVRGDPAPPSTKVCINLDSGYRNRMSFVLTGLDQQRKADPMTRPVTGHLEGMWNQSQERRAEQRSGRKADEVRQHGRAPARIERQEHAGREGAQRTAQRREHDDQGQATQGSYCCVRGREYRSG